MGGLLVVNLPTTSHLHMYFPTPPNYTTIPYSQFLTPPLSPHTGTSFAKRFLHPSLYLSLLFIVTIVTFIPSSFFFILITYTIVYLDKPCTFFLFLFLFFFANLVVFFTRRHPPFLFPTYFTFIHTCCFFLYLQL
ncbi:hypothetical protein BC941DRAFT_431715 [Chlamydoabsidia padenii]|nr:hypothetical protein BC941DRAFT_431715 [Chlamydoabsidia padenii]